LVNWLTGEQVYRYTCKPVNLYTNASEEPFH